MGYGHAREGKGHGSFVILPKGTILHSGAVDLSFVTRMTLGKERDPLGTMYASPTFWYSRVMFTMAFSGPKSHDDYNRQCKGRDKTFQKLWPQ
jgi:hypothetical protein